MTDGIFHFECWGFFLFCLIFFSHSFNWKDLFGQDFGGDGGLLLLGQVNRGLPRGRVAARGREPPDQQER